MFFPVTRIIIIEHLLRVSLKRMRKQGGLLIVLFAGAMCPEEDSGRTREVIAAKYTVDRREEPVEFLSSTILGRAKGEKEKKN